MIINVTAADEQIDWKAAGRSIWSRYKHGASFSFAFIAAWDKKTKGFVAETWEKSGHGQSQRSAVCVKVMSLSFFLNNYNQ